MRNTSRGATGHDGPESSVTFAGIRNNPRVPGGELHGPLAGCYKIKLRQQGVRLVYSVEDDHLLVTVVAVDKREDGVVYESAIARLSAAAAALTKALREKLKK